MEEGIDFAIWLMGAYEPEVIRGYVPLLREGAVVLDIGANVGAHTLPLARCVGSTGCVYAVEPTDYAIGKLRGNLQLNPELAQRVAVRQLLLMGRRDTAMPEGICSSWPLGTRRQGELSGFEGAAKPLVHAQVETLDDFVDQAGLVRLDLVKLDVDGHEMEVLSGGLHTLRRFRPPVIVELAPFIPQSSGHGFCELVECFLGMGYRFVNLHTGRALPQEAVAIEKMIPQGASINALALCQDNNR